MDQKKLIAALGRMKVETGSMVCLGCGHEHNCGVRGCALIRAAQDTLSTLQAENEKLRADLERVKRERDAAQSLLAERIGVMGAEPITAAFGLPLDRLRELAQAELEQVKRERDAAESDIETALAYGMKDCELCKNSQCYVRGGTKPCLPKWRGIQKNSSPYLVEDEVTEFTKKQWDWLLRRFTRSEQDG